MRVINISIKDKIRALAEKSSSLKEFQVKEKDGFFANSLSLVNNFKNKQQIFYPLSQSSWDYNEHNAIIDQLYSGNLTMGEKVENFEKRFEGHRIQTNKINNG